MSRITKIWKRHLGPKWFDLWFQYRGIPVPQGSLTTQTYAGFGQDVFTDEASADCRLHPRHPRSELTFPRRPVFGDLVSAREVVQRIVDPEQRAVHLQRIEGNYSAAIDEFIAEIRFGRITHDSGVVLTADGCYLADISGLDRSMPDPTNPLLRKFLPPPRTVSGCVAAVTCRANYNYYHWIMEALPRLLAYRQLGVAIDWYYAPQKHRFQRDSLAMLGVPPERTLNARARTHIRADNLLVSSPRWWHVWPATREKTDFLHSAFTANLPSQSARPLRIYVSRRRRGKRIVVNETEVLRELSRLGFRRYDLETMTVAEQVALFHQAECVVGPHGAGLVNLVFSRPGTKVIEIGTPYRPHPCFHEISYHRELDYQLYLARPVDVSEFSPENGLGDSNLSVPAKQFANHVAAFLDASPAGSEKSPNLPHLIGLNTQLAAA
jgi:hypothetical protein